MEASKFQLGCNEMAFYQQALENRKRAGRGSDRDLVGLEAEIESLRRKRPPSLRMNVASGKKERDPQYHCLMEQVRRRTMKFSVSRLRGALNKGSQRYSLQTVLEGALKEVDLLKKKETLQKETMLSLAEKKEKLKQRLRELGSDDGDSAISSQRSSPEPYDSISMQSPQPSPLAATTMMLPTTYDKVASPASTISSCSFSSASSSSLSSLSGTSVAPVPLAMPFYPPVLLQTRPSAPPHIQQYPNLVMYPFMSTRVPVISPPFNTMNSFCRIIPQNHFFPTLVSTVKQIN